MRINGESVKTFTIALLFVSLLAFTVLNWAYDREDVNLFSGALQVEYGVRPVTISEPAQPVAATVTLDGVMYACGYGDAAVGTVYERCRMLLSDALATAAKRLDISLALWEAQVETDSIYFEFLDSVPVWALAEGISSNASQPLEDLSVKSLRLSGDGLFIYTGDAYYRCDVFLDFQIPSQLENGLSTAWFVNGAVVYDRSLEFPTAFFSGRYTEEAYLSEIVRLFGFNPNTKSRYTQPNGDTVFVDEQRTLHVSPNGRVTYHDGTRYAYEPTDTRSAVRSCLNAIPSGAAFWGDGRLMLGRVGAADGGVSVEFNYVLSGAPFLECASVFIVKGSNIVEANMQLCPAFLGESSVELMPLRQAALLLAKDKDLRLCYALSESGEWLPQWYSR